MTIEELDEYYFYLLDNGMDTMADMLERYLVPLWTKQVQEFVNLIDK